MTSSPHQCRFKAHINWTCGAEQVSDLTFGPINPPTPPVSKTFFEAFKDLEYQYDKLKWPELYNMLQNLKNTNFNFLIDRAKIYRPIQGRQLLFVM